MANIPVINSPRLSEWRSFANPITPEPDPDWRATNDWNAMRDAGATIRLVSTPITKGWVRMVLQFVDASGLPVDVGNNTRVTVEPILLVSVARRDGTPGVPFLVGSGDPIELRGESLVTLNTEPLLGEYEIGLRLINTASLPNGWQALVVGVTYT